ncbi:hypothetical protein A1O7_02326 [Cladophialophora yegresii CBS 114405]|uniref:Nudix hydrolase domain-containing protein n=1 Tax=Cladophialophora yegresii CBS 114405 TaxID=1182544 RepID=W9WA85_9EURO|nr:uncharacterized protein A1O7_02326 [Cladophialophora yegresii CBS 114405]EXJ61895.1 hypothetical protein A1O7_02326 [Cladophialophora yegresii CBS 114405]
MAKIKSESTSAVDTASTPSFNFTSHASLSPFTVPYRTYIANRLNARRTSAAPAHAHRHENPREYEDEYDYQHVAVGALVFARFDPDSQSQSHNKSHVDSHVDSHANSHVDFTARTDVNVDVTKQPSKPEPDLDPEPEPRPRLQPKPDAEPKLHPKAQPQPQPQPSPSPSPRILLLRRSPHDSMPLRWEPPGGACDTDDSSILHACARELWEESGLVATSILGLIRTGGRVFWTRSGKTVCKFEFVVEVGVDHGDVNVDGVGGAASAPPPLWQPPHVRLDPNEHVDFVWATEEDCVAGRMRKGDQDVELVFTNEAQRRIILGGFRLVRIMTDPKHVEQGERPVMS